jgi:hypothetical protein
MSDDQEIDPADACRFRGFFYPQRIATIETREAAIDQHALTGG